MARTLEHPNSAPSPRRGFSRKSWGKLGLVCWFVLLCFGISAVDLCPKSADAQTTSDLSRSDWDALWNGSQESEPDDGKRAAARKAIADSLKKNVPGALDKVGKGLSLVGAGQVWYHNYLVLKPVFQSGDVETQVLDTQFAPAPGSIISTGELPDGTLGTSSVITYVKYRVTDTNRASLYFESRNYASGYEKQIFSTQTCWKTSFGAIGIQDTNTSVSNTSTQAYAGDFNGEGRKCYANGTEGASTPPTMQILWTSELNGIDIRYSGDMRGYTVPGPSFSKSSRKYFTEVLPKTVGAEVIITPDTYETGGLTEAPPEYEPSGDDIVLTPEETEVFIREAVDSPGWEPYRTPVEEPGNEEPEVNPSDGLNEEQKRQFEEKKRQHGAVVWFRDNPDGSRTYRFANGTEWTTWPDGSSRTDFRDGVTEWRDADGTITRYDPRTGQRTTTYPDGTTRVDQFGPNASPMEDPTAAPESTSWTDPAGNPIQEPQTGTYPAPTAPPARGGGGGSTNQTGNSCDLPKRGGLIVPPVNFGEKFPFSLIIGAKDTAGKLVGERIAPEFDLPMLGVVSLARFENEIGIMRNVLLFFIGGILMPIYFYTLIKGGSNE